jgi:hypothetical protein
VQSGSAQRRRVVVVDVRVAPALDDHDADRNGRREVERVVFERIDPEHFGEGERLAVDNEDRLLAVRQTDQRILVDLVLRRAARAILVGGEARPHSAGERANGDDCRENDGDRNSTNAARTPKSGASHLGGTSQPFQTRPHTSKPYQFGKNCIPRHGT